MLQVRRPPGRLHRAFRELAWTRVRRYRHPEHTSGNGAERITKIGQDQWKTLVSDHGDRGVLFQLREQTETIKEDASRPYKGTAESVECS